MSAQSIFTVFYYYTPKSSNGQHESSFTIRAESDLVAFHIAAQQAQSRHPGCVVVVKEVRRR